MKGPKDTAVRTVRNPGRVRRKLWAYGYAEIAAFLGTTEAAVRVAIHRGHLDPGSLESLHAAKLRGTRALYAVKGQ
jgi:hypothetical protein